MVAGHDVFSIRELRRRTQGAIASNGDVTTNRKGMPQHRQSVMPDRSVAKEVTLLAITESEMLITSEQGEILSLSRRDQQLN